MRLTRCDRFFGRVVFLLLLLIGNVAFASADRELTYRAADGSPLRLLAFLPAPQKRLPSAAMFFFGGGWRVGSVQQFVPFCEWLKSYGMTCFLPDYRVSSRQGTDGVDAVADARAAFAFVLQQSAQFGYDPQHVYVGGGSAGGHLAAAVGVIPDQGLKYLPRGLLLFNPALDLGRSARMQSIFRGQAAAFSPIEFVREDLPATWIVHGTADKVVPHSTAADFCARMQSHGNACELVSFAAQGHGFFNVGKAQHGAVREHLLAYLQARGALANVSPGAPDPVK